MCISNIFSAYPDYPVVGFLRSKICSKKSAYVTDNSMYFEHMVDDQICRSLSRKILSITVGTFIFEKLYKLYDSSYTIQYIILTLTHTNKHHGYHNLTAKNTVRVFTFLTTFNPSSSKEVFMKNANNIYPPISYA